MDLWEGKEIVIVQIFLLTVLVTVVPMAVGGIFVDVDYRAVNLPFRWISGQICLWAGFQIICVPLVMSEKKGGFVDVILLFSVYTVAMFLFSVSIGIRRKLKAIPHERLLGRSGEKWDFLSFFMWALVFGLLAVQLFLAVFLCYEEGDDAFYVAVASITSKSGTMYQILPYTGGTTGLDARHGLAPFPVWVAMLSKVTGIEAVTVAKVILPVILIIMSYSIFYLIGRELFSDSHRLLPVFMIAIELLVIFGGQSVYTAENFLLVRTAQGKAVLANIVIPFLFLLLLGLMGKLENREKISIKHWILFGLTMLAGCLCSTLGALLTCILPGVVGVCGAVSYRNWKVLAAMGICCILPAGMALLYLMVG